ncbi:MAG: hypothetical protein IJ287_01685 [Methanobrevibacter sp.]|nr:hypothetical protein [Methanobrevibacter sp.]
MRIPVVSNGGEVQLVDDKYLFTGDTIWFGADGGYSFISTLAEDNKLSMKSLEKLENNLRSRNLNPLVITGHTGWSQDLDIVFAHKDKKCSPLSKRVHDPDAPYDGYDESDDTRENTLNSGYLKAKY